MEFAKKLQRLRAARRYSQEALALELGCSQNLVSLWCRGKALPDLKEAARIATLFGVSVDFLADDGQDEPMVRPAEEAAVKLVRSLMLGENEVIRRLAAATPPMLTARKTEEEPRFTIDAQDLMPQARQCEESPRKPKRGGQAG